MFYKGALVVQFGLRRSSRKETGHGHLPGSLHLSASDTQRLANCPMSYDEWVGRMKEKGYIADEEEDRA